MESGVELLGREQLVRNLSEFQKNVVRAIVIQVEITQIRIKEAAQADHGAGAHAQGRYVSRTETLSRSIQPGRVYVKDNEVSAEMRAGDAFANYASFVEKRYPYLGPAIRQYQNEFVDRVRRAVKANA